MMTRPTSRRASARTSRRLPPSAFIADLHLLQAPADPPVGVDRIRRLPRPCLEGGDQLRPAFFERPGPLLPADAQDLGPGDAASEDRDQARRGVAAGDDTIRRVARF